MEERERHRRLKEIFAAAVELETGAVEDFLVEACAGDRELLAELRQLVAFDQVDDDQFLARPAAVEMAEQGLVPPPTDLPPVRDPEQPPVADWDRYHELELVASGGMGEVYRAFDPRLKRYTALKFLRGANRKQVERFVREAEAQAKVEHDNVLEVYETGEVSGQRFIAMRFVDGPTLGGTREDTTLDDKVRIMRQVADAVHAAHREGLVHRDIKPGNILMERAADGRYKPYVMDFGIATSLEGPGLTTTGDLLGTPWYMAPERVSWGPSTADRRSDVYSLGVTLFEYLCGDRPFVADSPLEMLSQLSEAEPRRLRSIDPSLPTDLETIVMKCLERDPNRRYPSARALAEDLQRYLDGEPIQARPATLTYRLLIRARRHRVAVVMAVAALLVLAAMVALNLRSWQDGRQRETLARDFAHRVQGIENLMRMARVAPLHDVSSEEAMVKLKMNAIRDRIAQVGEIGEGSGHYALGRGYLALGELRRAREHLERAWNRGYRGPEVAFALGQVLGELYREQLTQVERLGDEDSRERRRSELDRELKQPALEYLRASGGVGGESPEYARAVTAFVQGRFDLALEQAREAHAKLPWLFDAYKLEGDILTTMGLTAWQHGDADHALTRWLDALDAYAAATRVARSDTDGWLRTCTLSRSVLELCTQENLGDPQAIFAVGRDACSNALTTRPDLAEGHRLLSALYCLNAELAMSGGGDPRASLESAVRSARRAFGLDERSVSSHLAIGNAWLTEARYEALSDRDPMRSLDEAVTAFERAVDADGRSARAHGRLGEARLQRAERMLAVGADPEQELTASIESLAAATAITRLDIHGHEALGRAQLRLARYLEGHGEDPSTLLEQSVAAYDQALRINPEYVAALLGRAEALTESAHWQSAQGGDPTAAVDAARGACNRVLELEPDGERAAAARRILGELKRIADGVPKP